jgi:hypothetical protein
MAHYFGFLLRITTDAEAVQHDVYDSLPTTARLSGALAQVVQWLRGLIDDFDVMDNVNVIQFRRYLTHEQVLGSIQLSAEWVMPAFQPVAALC